MSILVQDLNGNRIYMREEEIPKGYTRVNEAPKAEEKEIKEVIKKPIKDQPKEKEVIEPKKRRPGRPKKKA